MVDRGRLLYRARCAKKQCRAVTEWIADPRLIPRRCPTCGHNNTRMESRFESDIRREQQ